MSDEAPPQEEDAGAPAWVMTFADLMSLLMCFFVLLLSFSEMDLQKYKQVAGSMKNAFGVQREIKTMEMPKGTSVIAQEFSPGRPSPTPLNVIRQNSIDDTKQTLEFTDVTTKKEDGEDDTSGEDGDGTVDVPIQRPTEAEQIRQLKELGLDEELLESYSQALDTDPDTAADAQQLLRAMEDEVRKGLIEIGTEGKKILVRIREKGSFPSGSDRFRVDFIPVLVKLRGELKTIAGQVRIAGHTDNVPINTVRFRSNWELSSSRSVSVAHELLKNEELARHRFVVEGHGDASPLAPNDTPANRALNRRVELTIVQGETLDDQEYRQLMPRVQEPTNSDDNSSEATGPGADAGSNSFNGAKEQMPGENPGTGTGVNLLAGNATTGEEKASSGSTVMQKDSKTPNAGEIDQQELEARIRKFSKKNSKITEGTTK